MCIIFEISGPFCRKPFYKRTNSSYNVDWLYFAIRVIPNLDAFRLITEPHGWDN